MFTAYASRKGYTLIEGELYLPEAWFTQTYAERWKKCGIPDERVFQTKPDIAVTMLKTIMTEETLPGRWVAADEGFGRVPAFLDDVAKLGLWYFAEVPLDTRVWQRRPETHVPPWSGRGRPPTQEVLVPNQPAPVPVDVLAQQLPDDAWQLYQIKEGSRGPLVAEFAFLRVVAVRDSLPGPTVWVIFRRSLDREPELKAYFCNAPADIQQAEMVRIAGMRWPIETAIEECKGGLGMDHYEVRTWSGWHHHMTLCILAHHFLVRTRARLKKKHPL